MMDSVMRRALRALRAYLFSPPPTPPGAGPSEDPDAGVREPRRGGPAGRGSAVALSEPEPDRSVAAIGRNRQS